jgi:hypothetical protein
LQEKYASILAGRGIEPLSSVAFRGEADLSQRCIAASPLSDTIVVEKRGWLKHLRPNIVHVLLTYPAEK